MLSDVCHAAAYAGVNERRSICHNRIIYRGCHKISGWRRLVRSKILPFFQSIKIWEAVKKRINGVLPWSKNPTFRRLLPRCCFICLKGCCVTPQDMTYQAFMVVTLKLLTLLLGWVHISDTRAHTAVQMGIVGCWSIPSDNQAKLRSLTFMGYNLWKGTPERIVFQMPKPGPSGLQQFMSNSWLLLTFK